MPASKTPSKKKAADRFRICVIGDSHVAAFRLGWDEIKGDFPSVDVTFYATSRDSMRRLESNGSKLFFKNKKLAEKVTSLSGTESIDVADFDAILCVGMANSLHRLVSLQKHFSIVGEQEPSRYLTSRNAMIDTWTEKFQGGPLDNVLSKLAEAKATAVYAVLKPYVASTILASPKNKNVSSIYRSMMENAAHRDLVKGILEEARDNAFAGRAIAIDQPVETTEGNVLTREEFSIGSVRLMDDGEEHEEAEYKHMNKDYGSVCWKAILPKLLEQGA